MKDILPLTHDDFGLFRELLTEKSGLQFEKGRGESLHLALWQRLQHRGCDSYREYYDLLRSHPEGRLELREILDLITIGETYFFRNRPQFDVLMKCVLPDALQRKETLQDKELRVWSAGCSRGDEAYSLAIAILEVVPPDGEWKISIFGTDVNRNGLACAKEGVYGEKGIAHLPREYLGKYFKSLEKGYQLHAPVKEMVQFEYHNLASDPFLHEKMQRIDILFCRNVLIYFDVQTRGRMIESFYNCLAPEGYLFLGHSETLWQIPHKFERVEFPQAFIYRKTLSPFEGERMKRSGARSKGVSEQRVPERKTEAEKGVSLRDGMMGLREEPSSLREAGKSSDFSLSSFHAPVSQGESLTDTYLAKATLLANEAKYEEAADLLAKIIEADNLSVDAYYLLGVLSRQCSRPKEAEAFFRKVIYINPDSVLAYFNLGSLYLHQRKFREAGREFRTAIRLLEKRPKEEQVDRYEDLTVEFLLTACKNNLMEISKRGEGHE